MIPIHKHSSFSAPACALALIIVAAPGCSSGTDPASTTPASDSAGASANDETPKTLDGVDIPPPLTEAQIAAMTKQEALDMVQRVSEARSVAMRSGDQALRERLKREFDLLMAHVKETPPELQDPAASDEPPPIPDPLTAEQVAAMTRAEAFQAATAVVAARRWAERTNDAELTARLKAEFDMLMERIRQP